MSEAHLVLGLHPVADLDVRQALPDRVDERVGDVADGDDDRDGHAALMRPEPYPADTAASAAMSTSASGSTIMWFFAPPRAWMRFPCFVPVS